MTQDNEMSLMIFYVVAKNSQPHSAPRTYSILNVEIIVQLWSINYLVEYVIAG